MGHVLFWEQRALTLVRAALGDEKAPSLRLPGEEGEWIHRQRRDRRPNPCPRNWDDLWSALHAYWGRVVKGRRRAFGARPVRSGRPRPHPQHTLAYDIIANNTFDHDGEHLVNLRGWSGSRIVGLMKFGFVLPYAESRDVAELARLAEELGWDGFFVWKPVWASHVGDAGGRRDAH